MKTLKNQTILYDEECPLCQTYTSAFIATGMLDKNGRKPYQEINTHEIPFLDSKRAANEIALIDYENQKVIYGIDSLLKIIGHSFPLIKTIGEFKAINFLLKKFYSFISYNRKVIMPITEKKEQSCKCEPSFNVKYRLFYLLFAVGITTILLFKFSELIPFIPKSNFSREAAIAIGQLVFQRLFLLNRDYKTTLNYLGNVMTVSLYGCLLLTPILLSSLIIKINPMVALAWFGITVTLMLAEHSRRITILQLPKYLSVTWILYRLLILFIILNHQL